MSQQRSYLSDQQMARYGKQRALERLEVFSDNTASGNVFSEISAIVVQFAEKLQQDLLNFLLIHGLHLFYSMKLADYWRRLVMDKNDRIG